MGIILAQHVKGCQTTRPTLNNNVFNPAPMASPGLEPIFQFNRRQHGIIKPTQTDGSLDAGSTAHALFLETFFETTTMEI
jgi:hypothetical protein